MDITTVSLLALLPQPSTGSESVRRLLGNALHPLWLVTGSPTPSGNALYVV